VAKVLIVDDNFTYRKVVAAVLGLEGYAMLEAADGTEALALPRKERAQRFGKQALRVARYPKQP
jgi:CheY-like chemotaxis protein